MKSYIIVIPGVFSAARGIKSLIFLPVCLFLWGSHPDCVRGFISMGLLTSLESDRNRCDRDVLLQSERGKSTRPVILCL